ncbi:hypothetical protein LIER_35151 [Lithospermum erythrorhizon]|uniref:Reverse transcriptase n=1 Tax=Lithospermum erythrorhizon TaxID=34254 RepID=A0AAV3NKL1_LITER
MDIFNSLLMRNIEARGFYFHPKCQELKLTNICFVDDLFLVAGASERLFRVIKDILLEFGSMAGLKPNMGKSTCYYAGVIDEMIDKLDKIMRIPAGTLPVKSLGIPFATSQITTRDCRSLCDKICSRIDG